MRAGFVAFVWVLLLASAPIVGAVGGPPTAGTVISTDTSTEAPAAVGAAQDGELRSESNFGLDAKRGWTDIDDDERGDPVVGQRFTYDFTPSRDETFDVTMSFETTRDLSDICINVPDSYAVVSKTGIETAGVYYDCPYKWDGTTASPEITFRVNSTERTGDLLSTYEGDTWGLTVFNSWNNYRVKGDSTWRDVDDPADSRTETIREVAGDGVAADRFVYFGAADVETWHVNNERFRLVEPRGVSVDHDAIRESLTTSARTLDIGGRSDGVTVFAARDPIRKGGFSWEQSMWVHQRMRVTNVYNVWVHEYVHSRQQWSSSPELEWLDEGSADYYAAMAMYRQGSVSFSRFHEYMSTDDDASVVLADAEEAVETGAEYTKGRRVVAALDRKIRRATDGNRTFQDVLYLMNRHDGRVTFSAFKDMVETVAEQSMDDWLDRFVTTDAVPRVAMDESWVTEPPTDRDADGDGLVEDEEKERGLDPFDPDSDNDGLNDSVEVAGDSNPHVADSDGDGLKDGREVELGTDPTMYDTDTDGIDDETEVEDRRTDPTLYDTDGDGLDDGEEHDSESLDPLTADTDGDGLDDGEEVRAGTGPSSPDSDGDGVEDGREDELGTDPLVEDTDDDGLIDGDELDAGTDPLESDTDGDGLDDAEEVNGATDPLDADSDGDGVEDGADPDPMAAETTPSDGGLPGPMPGFGLGVSALAVLVLGAIIRRQRR